MKQLVYDLGMESKSRCTDASRRASGRINIEDEQNISL